MTSFRSLDRDGLDGVLPAPEVPPPTKNFLAWIVLIFILLAVISSWLWSENIKSTVTENSLELASRFEQTSTNINKHQQTSKNNNVNKIMILYYEYLHF